MAQLELQAADNKKTKRRIHFSPRVDMTPMVDLGFLLITFFILTTTMSEQSSMKLFMPKDGPSSLVGESKVLTVLLGGNNKVYAYEGAFEEAMKRNRILVSNYNIADGIGSLIRQKQKQMEQTGNGKNDLVFLIKPSKQSTYKNVIDALDETAINDVKKYMLLDPSIAEAVFIQK